jgi:hypothetical protein
MNTTIAYPVALAKYQPLPHVVCFDDFDRGLNGWMDLHPNHTHPGFKQRPSVYDKTKGGPVCLSTASFGWAGTHGSLDGIYSLKLATRPVAGRYEEMPVPGAISHSIKRLSFYRAPGLYQYETWFAYTPELDRIGVGEKDIRAFAFILDIQDEKHRYQPCLRYVNSVNGRLVKRWQYGHSIAAGDREWCYGADNEWACNGIDALWHGYRRPDGSTDAFQWLPDGDQELVYNETDDKINWIYFRMTVDLAKREYVEMECQGRVFDMRGLQPTLAKKYDRITGLINPWMWIENDADRRVYFYIDSVCLSAA